MCELLFPGVQCVVLLGCQALWLCWLLGCVGQSSGQVQPLPEQSTDSINSLRLQLLVGVLQVTAGSLADASHVVVTTASGGESQPAETVICVGPCCNKPGIHAFSSSGLWD